MILDSDYSVRFAPFPLSVPALTAKDKDGHYNIYINSFLSKDMQKQALDHELEHIVKGDFESQKHLESIETCSRATTTKDSGRRHYSSQENH